MLEIKTHVFQNGLPLVYLPLPTAKVVTVILMVGSGSRFETADTRGISRFYANVCFQGSKPYPTRPELDQAIDQLGLSLRPTVYPEYSLFYFSTLPQNLEPSLELFFNLLYAPSLTEEGLAEEKRLSSFEVELMSLRPQFLSVRMLSSGIFNHESLGFDVLGSKEGVQNVTQESLTQFKNQYYVSQNCLLVLSGPDQDFSLAKLNRFAEAVPAGQRQTPPAFDFSQTKIVQEKSSQMGKTSLLTYGFPCFGRNSEKRLSQNLLLNILSTGRSNQRLKTLQDKKIVSEIRPWIQIFQDCGLFLLQASCPAEKEKSAHEEILNQLNLLASGSISEQELALAKVAYQNRLLEKLASPLELGFFYALGCFFNLAEQTPEELVEKTEKVSLGEVNEAAKTIFRPDLASWVIVGPGV